MKSLPQKEQCVHYLVCQYAQEGTCPMECGHFTALKTRKGFYEMICDVYKQKMDDEKNKFEYINPNAMSDILHVVEAYSQQEVNSEIWDWVQDMYGT